ncbi:MAG TPA: hypothetical protein VMT94_01350 [Burkholderiales bacterium]|nr:hypothetical protein [Burkholderiales bacterium]
MSGSTALSAAWPRPFELALRLTIAYALAVWLAYRYGRNCIDALLPALEYAVSLTNDVFRIVAMTTDSHGPDTVLRLRVELARPLTIGAQIWKPHAGGWMDCVTTLGLLQQPAIVMLGLTLAWPLPRPAAALWRALFTALALGVIVFVHTPFFLWASLWSTFVAVYDPRGFYLLCLWHDVLLNGGQLAIGLLAGIAIIRLADRLGRRETR